MKRYDPSKAPPAAEWLELDEPERIELVRQYHKRERIELPNVNVHAVVHAIVENQLAAGLAKVQDALQRLQGEGLDRHDAVHAIGSVLAEHMWKLANKPQAEGDPNAAYFAALDRLTAESWRNSE